MGLMRLELYILVTFVVCLCLGFIGIRVAPALGLLDIPGGRRQHERPVPLVGGLALILSLLAVAAFRGFNLPLSSLELGAIICMALLGLVDDRLDLRARYKAGMGLIVAFVLAAGTMHHLGPHPAPFTLLGLTVAPVPWLLFILLVLLFWCIPHSFNLIDGANGLATGFALVVLGSLWAAGVQHPMVLGALLACLVLNWPKARLFLGDCGSLSIGLVLVIYGQKAFLLSHPNHLMWLFAYPITDVVMVICIRLLIGAPVYQGDRSHMHYQIKDRWPALSGLAVPGLLSLSALCGSEIYLAGRWVVAPWVGLILLVSLSAGFAFLTVKSSRESSARALRLDRKGVSALQTE